MDGIVGKTYQTYHSLPSCQEIDISRHKLTQNDNFVSKYPSSVAAILKPRCLDHMTPIFQPTPISDPGPQSSWASLFNMGIPLLVRRHLYLETAPRTQWVNGLYHQVVLFYLLVVTQSWAAENNLNSCFTFMRLSVYHVHVCLCFPSGIYQLHLSKSDNLPMLIWLHSSPKYGTHPIVDTHGTQFRCFCPVFDQIPGIWRNDLSFGFSGFLSVLDPSRSA